MTFVLVGVALVLASNDSEEGRVLTSTGGLPAQFVALTDDGHLELRRSANGETVRTITTLQFSGPATLAVTPDGSAVYLSRNRRFEPGECVSEQDTLMDEIVRVDLESGTITPIGRGADPALSPDGHRLAYTRQTNGICRTGTGSQELVIRDLGDGREKTFPAGAPGTYLLSELSWAPDGQHVAFRLQKPDTSTYPHVLDLERSERLLEARRVDMGDGHGWHGYLGDTGRILGSFLAGSPPDRPSSLVELDPDTGQELSLLVTIGTSQVWNAAADASGNHVLFETAGTPTHQGGLYRWSRTDSDAVRIGDAATAAWVPGQTVSQTVPTIVVPDVEGVTLNAAQSALRAVGLTGSAHDTDPQDPDAVVARQEPPAGVVVPVGGVVGFRTASVTPELCAVLDDIPRRRGDALDLADQPGFEDVLREAEPRADAALKNDIRTVLDSIDLINRHAYDGSPPELLPSLDSVAIHHDACTKTPRPGSQTGG